MRIGENYVSHLSNPPETWLGGKTKTVKISETSPKQLSVCRFYCTSGKEIILRGNQEYFDLSKWPKITVKKEVVAVTGFGVVDPVLLPKGHKFQYVSL